MKIWGKYLIVLLALCLLVLGGCQNQTEETTEQLPEGVIKDQLGREVILPEQIDKVAATHIYGGKMLFAMGQKNKVAYQMQLGADLEALAQIDEYYGSLPTISSTPNGADSPESLSALGVDLVFFDVSEVDEAEAYENAGITTVAVSGETFDEVYETARLMGQIFGNESQAEELIDFIENKRNLVEGRTEGLKDDEKPVVLVTGSGGVYTAATSSMFQHQMIETAGGINAGADLTGRWARISAEDIIAMDPDYIILGSSFGVDTVESVLDDPALQTVTAVKNQDVYIFPSNLGWWDFPLPQSVLGIIWTGTIIHPELFSDIDILAEANEVYQTIYGYTYTELGGVITDANRNQ